MADKQKDKSKLLAPIQGGAKLEKYTWTQDIGSLMITHDLPANVRGKQITVQFSAKRLKVEYVDSAMERREIINGELAQECDAKECQWQIETENDKRQLILHLQKTCGTWWASVIKGDPEIDTDKLDAPTIGIHELGGEARMTVEKMLYDQHAKAVGKPTSEDILKKQQIAKLQQMYPQMDFSQCDFSNSNFSNMQ